MLSHALGWLVTAVAVLTLYRFIYTFVGAVAKSKKFPEAKTKHTFGILIAARNESAVIGRLIDSIEAQDYDRDKFKIFVVADNCTDDTAEICRRCGAVVYERYDPSRARKGYAISYLIDCIKRDFGADCVDGYVFFDADNLLKPNFLTEMNRAFDTGADICIGYRNTKNFSENAVSAAYGIHFMRSSSTWHRPRSLFGLSTHIAGTGWAVRSSLLRDGWDCTSLTEDTEFTMKNVAEGHTIEYCEDAEFYDEQPHELATAIRQRTRWIKGRLSCFMKYADSLLDGIFTPGKRIRTRLSCYDMFFYLFPGGLFTAACTAIPSALEIIYGMTAGGISVGDIASVLKAALVSLALYWIFTVLTGVLVVVRERRHIKCCTAKMIKYLLLWPWFDLIEVPLSIVSLFYRVEWKPIKHDRPLTLEQVESGKY